MNVLASLVEELERNDAAQAAMAVIQSALERRTEEERGAFWNAVGIYYVSRKAPPESSTAAAANLSGAMPEGA